MSKQNNTRILVSCLILPIGKRHDLPSYSIAVQAWKGKPQLKFHKLHSHMKLLIVWFGLESLRLSRVILNIYCTSYEIFAWAWHQKTSEQRVTKFYGSSRLPLMLLVTYPCLFPRKSSVFPTLVHSSGKTSVVLSHFLHL